MSLFFNKLSRLAITFLPRNKRLLISWLQSPSAVIFGAQKSKVWHRFHCFPIYLPWSDGTRCHDIGFLNVELWANFYTLLFHYRQEALWLFISSSLSAIRVVSSEYLKLLICLLAILIPACFSSSPAFLMMRISYAYNLNKQGNNIQAWHTPSPIWNQSIVPCPVLTVASWSAYRFLRRQIRWSGIPVSLRIFHSLLWSTQSKALA